MTKTSYFALWGGMFILCAGLGFIPDPAGALRILMILLAVVFFLPPAGILLRAAKESDRRTLVLIRNLSLLSLAGTLLTILANFLSLMAPETVGNILYGFLVIISSPMVCGQYWVLGLFGWACLLMVSLSQLRKSK